MRLIYLACLLFACHTPPKPDPAKNAAVDSDEGSVFNLAHPKKPTASATLALIQAHEQPDPEEIKTCQKYLIELAKLAGVDDDMVSAKKQLEPDVRENTSTYHWCFYQTLTQMDEELAKPARNFEEHSQYFYRKMKELWPLARALDSATAAQDQPYSHFLLDRYVNISHEQFGRDLERVGKFIDQSPGAPVPGS